MRRFLASKKAKREETDNDSEETDSDNEETDEEGSEGLEEPLHEAGPSASRKTEAEIPEQNVPRAKAPLGLHFPPHLFLHCHYLSLRCHCLFLPFLPF